ncbi:YheC/YheD family protein [Bacillus sp. FJAT-44742]|uniref:YheC/YheD family protein n=1 Tax=Bacillus sp. FJAT-44742 TaxID=2014005 RepID=UPI000C2401AD|nr:YheC/YheD family protein [Bacillus sp. FJAT-44742]
MEKKPLIGILVRKPIKLRNYEMAKSLNIDLLVFTPKGINWTKKKIRGWFFNGHSWQRKSCPFPSAVYNRRYSANKNLVTKLEKIIGKGKVFNTITWLDKWVTHQILQKSSIKSYLPHTSLYQSENFLDLLTTYRKLILKPCKGSLGKQVYLVELTDDNKYKLYINTQKQETSQSVPEHDPDSIKKSNMSKEDNETNKQKLHALLNDERLYDQAKINTDNQDEFIKSIDELIKDKTFLVQQFISLDQTEQKIYDLRVYVHRNEQGKWFITGAVSRIGNKTSYITNMSSEIKSLSDILKSNNMLTAYQMDAIKTISIQVAQELEKALGHMGELGIDFGIDQKGKPWLIEVNGKPQKISILRRVRDPDLTRELYAMPLKYAYFLATNKVIPNSPVHSTSPDVPAGNLGFNPSLLERTILERKRDTEKDREIAELEQHLKETRQELEKTKSGYKKLMEKFALVSKREAEKDKTIDALEKRLNHTEQELEETKQVLIASKNSIEKLQKKWWEFWK